MMKNERLKQAREAAGFTSGSDAANRFGWKVPTYLGHENGARNFGVDTAERYARAFRVAVEWLMFGRDIAASAVDAEESPSDSLVPVYDVAASAGNGSHIEDEEVLCNLAFDRSFLRRMTEARPSELAIIRVKGHSMEPTLLDDDHVLVDRTKTNLSYDGLFVIRFDDALHIKRIGRSASRGNVLVISDHPSYPDLDMPKPDLDVIGRVLWVGRKV